MEFFFSLLQPLPTTFLVWTLEIVGSVIASLVFMSFFEYLVHGYFMHQKSLPEFMYRLVPPFENAFQDHATLHHGKYYKQFNFEPDPAGRDLNITISPLTTLGGFMLILPVVMLAAVYLSVVFAGALLAVYFLYNLVWNIIHPEMHKPQHPFWSRWVPTSFLPGNTTCTTRCIGSISIKITTLSFLLRISFLVKRRSLMRFSARKCGS